MRLRRLALLVLSAAFVAQGIPSPVAAAGRGAPPSKSPTLPSTTRAAGDVRNVDVRSVAKRYIRTRPNPSWLHAPSLPSPASGTWSFAAASATGVGAQAVEAATLFGGVSLVENERLYGLDQDVEPADAQIGASPSWLVEIAGKTMALFSPDGSLQWTVDLQALFQQPAGNVFYAPSLQYDWGTGRWFLGGIASNTTAHLSWLLIAVSRTPSPLGTWSVTTTDVIGNNPSQCQPPCPNNDYFMRESIAVTGDKVVQADQRVDCASGCNLNRRGAFVVMRKDQLVAGVQPTTDRFTLGDNQQDFLAVQTQSVGGTHGNVAFLVWLKVGDPSPTAVTRDRLGVLEITGLPSADRINSFQGTTIVWEKDFSAVMPPFSISPAQPGGTLSASPTPITSAIYRDEQLVLAMNDNCGATPDPRQVYCVRVIKITNFDYGTPIASDNGPIQHTEPPQIATDLDRTLGLPSANLFDASLSIDPFGRLFVSAAFSSPDLYPGMAVAGIGAPIGRTSTVMPTSRIVNGPGSYNCFAGTGNPWGAYMRSVPDPNNLTRVWLPGEVAVGSCWATAMVSATMGIAPWPVVMKPAVGSIKGGQVVEIDGSYFVPDADRVLFGSTPGIILDESPTAIIVVAPPGTAGPTPVTVLTPDGSASAGPFNYITPGQLSTPPISSGGHHWR